MHSPVLLAEKFPRFTQVATAYLKYSTALKICQDHPQIHFDVDLTNTRVVDVPFQSYIPAHCNLSDLNLMTLEISELVASNGGQAIASRQIQWQNESDDTVYTAICNIGSYDINSMVTEILRAMSSVKDKNGFSHAWYVSYASAPLNAMQFHNVIFVALTADPLVCEAGSSDITVTYNNHNLHVNDFVTFQSVNNNPGGISNDIFNDATFSISAVIDANHFVISTSSVAYANNQIVQGDGGGNSVKLGIGRFYQFIGEESRSALTLCGFPPRSGTNVSSKYDLNVDDFLKDFGTIAIPKQMLQDHPDLLPKTVVSTIGLDIVNLPQDYIVSDDGSTLRPRFSFNKQGLIHDINTRDNNRVLFTSPSSFSMARAQTNMFDSGSLYSSINLAGDVYCFLRETTTDKKFAKVQLRSGTGYIDYNTFYMNKFNESELRKLASKGTLSFMLTTPEGEPLFTKGLRLSGTLSLSFTPIIPALLYNIIRDGKAI